MLAAAEAGEADDFGAFCQRRISAGLDLNGWPRDGRVAVETTSGHWLEMVYDGPHRVDGEAIDYESYPLYGAPGVEAPLGTGRMTFRRGRAFPA